MYPERAQAGAFLPKLLEQAGLLKEAEKSAELVVGAHAEKAEESRKKAVMQRYEKTNESILELNVIPVYKKVVQGLIYSPPDCEKYLALDAKPQVSVALPRLWPDGGSDIRDCDLRESVDVYKRPDLWHASATRHARPCPACCISVVYLWCVA